MSAPGARQPATRPFGDADEDLVVFDRQEPTLIDDPYPTWERLRRIDPLHRTDQGTRLVTRYEDVVALLRNPGCGRKLPRALVQRMLGPGATKNAFLESLLNVEGDGHTRIRRLIFGSLAPSGVRALRTTFSRRIGVLLDDVAGQATFDAQKTVAQPLPILLVADVMGLAPDDVPGLTACAEMFHEPEGLEPDEAAAYSDEAVERLLRFFGECLRAPPAGLLRDLADAARSGSLSAAQAAANATVLLFAAATTYSNGIGNSLLALAQHPEHFQLLRETPGLIPDAVEELCRYDCPLQTVLRWTSSPVELSSGRIERRRLVEVILGSANRDPAAFDRPDELDFRRRPNSHVGFGHGARFCPGAHIARAATAALIDALLARYAAISLAAPPVRKRTLWDRGLSSLVLRGAPA